jgi:large subunit ribosomal protein L4
LHVALSSKLQSGLLRVIQTYDEAAWTGTRDASISLSDEHPAAFKARMEGANSMLEETEESENSLAEDPATPVPSSLTKFGQVHDLSITFIHGPSTSMSTLERIDRCLRNIPGIDILPVEDLAAYEVLRRKWTVMDVSAVEWLAARVGQSELMESVEDVEGESSEGRFEDVSATEASTPSTVNA